MANISKIKLPNDATTHTIKDSTARSNITKITNKTTKLAYGDELVVDGTDLKLLDPNDNVLSTVTLPTGGASGVEFGYNPSKDTYSSDWNANINLNSAIPAGGEADVLYLVPTPNDWNRSTYSLTTPYIGYVDVNNKQLIGLGLAALNVSSAPVSATTLYQGDTLYRSPNSSFLTELIGVMNRNMTDGVCVSNGSDCKVEGKFAYIVSLSADWCIRVFYGKIKNYSTGNLYTFKLPGNFYLFNPETTDIA